MFKYPHIGSRDALTWRQHGEDAADTANALHKTGDLEQQFSVNLENEVFARIPAQDNDELEFKYFYVEKKENSQLGAEYTLHAICFGMRELYEPQSGCFLGLQHGTRHVKFILDEQTIAAGNSPTIKKIVLSQLDIDD